MNKKQKQVLVGCIVNILFIPFLISFVMLTEGIVPWWVPLCLFGLALASVPIMKKVLNLDALPESAWKEEGYYDFWIWLVRSRSPLRQFIVWGSIWGAIITAIAIMMLWFSKT